MRVWGYGINPLPISFSMYFFSGLKSAIVGFAEKLIVTMFELARRELYD